MSTSTATYAPIGRGSGSLGNQVTNRKFVHFPSNPESVCYTDTVSFTGTQIDMPQFDPGENSSINSSAGTQDSGYGDSEYHILEKPEIHGTCKKFIQEIRTMAYLTQDFAKDVANTKPDKAVGLLDELVLKIKPYIVRLDERLSGSEDLIRKNLDQCRITDPRVNWLLTYHESIRKFREVLATLNCEIFEHLEEFLRLQVRGCVDSRISPHRIDSGQKALKRIVNILAQIEDNKISSQPKNQR